MHARSKVLCQGVRNRLTLAPVHLYASMKACLASANAISHVVLTLGTLPAPPTQITLSAKPAHRLPRCDAPLRPELY